jgi:hypothetical protein
MKIRYSRRRDTADHHALRLRREHRCSSQPQQTFGTPQAWRRRGTGVQVLEGNLRRVIGGEASGGELRALSREAMRSYARYWLEAFRLPVMPAARLAGGMRDTGHTETACRNRAGSILLGAVIVMSPSEAL